MSSLLASHLQAPPPPRTEAEQILSRLDVTLEIIEKEYDEFNHRHSSRKQKRMVPALFYSFYQSELCANFVLACHAYLVQFVRSPVQPGERLDGSGPSDSSRGSGLAGSEDSSNAGGRKLLALQSCLQRVSECWSSILMYRSEMNRYETITVSRTSKKSEHFLNDTYDHFFFEALYLLVEYMCEFSFLDQSRAQTYASDYGASAFNSSLPSPTLSPSASAAAAAAKAAAAGASGNLNAAVAAPSAPPKVKSTASAAAIAASVEANWRVAQHELQRILRSRHFNYSTRKRAPSSSPHLVRGNGLNHIPLASSSTLLRSGGAGGHHAASHPSRRSSPHGPSPSRSPGSRGASYRSVATFRLDGAPRSWDDDPVDPALEDDTRALSHLPAQFKQSGSFGIVDCLDLRSPMIASMLPNSRTMRAANEAYVFGAEKRRAGSARSHARLTHAEEKYLKSQRQLQAQRALEWKLRLEREEREEQAQEEEETRRKQAMDRRMDDETTEIKIETMPVPVVEANSGDAGVDAVPAAAAMHAVAAVSATPVPPLQLQLQPHPPSHPPRPTPLHHVSTGAALPTATAAADFPLHPSPPASGSASARSRPLRPASQPPYSAAASLTARGPGRLRPLSSHGAPTATAATPAAPTPRTRLTLDEALNSTKPLIQIHGNRISLVDFAI